MFNLAILLIFILFNIVWFQIPGLFLHKLLFKGEDRTAVKLLSGYFLGFTMMAVLYYVESLIKLPGVILVAGPILTIVAIVVWVKTKAPSVFQNGNRPRLATILSFIVIYAISFLSLQFWYAGAENGTTTQVFHDFLFHTGNIASLSRSFPNYDIRVSGVMFYYHYFYELIFAMCKHVFKVQAFSLYMNGNSVVTTWTLGLALNIVAELIRGEKEVSEKRYFFYTMGIFAGCFCLYPLNFVGAKLPFSWIDNHYFTNGNSLGVAASLDVLIIVLLVNYWNKKYSCQVMVGMMMLTIAATGFKGTTGAMLVAIAIAVFVVEMIINKHFEVQKCVYPLSMAVAFVATYFSVVVGIGASGANNRTTTLSPRGTLEWSRVGEVFERFLGIDYMSMPWIIIAIVGCIICMVGPCLLPFVLFSVKRFKELIKTGQIGEIFDWYVIGSAIIAIIALVAVTIEGLSQGYLLISTAPLIFVVVMRYLVDSNSKLLKSLMIFFFVCGLLMQLGDVAYYINGGLKQNAKYSTAADDAEELVSDDTMAAYHWLRENTAEDSVIAVDRHTENLDWRQIYFYCSAFSERQCYIEGFDYSDVAEEVSEDMLLESEKMYSSDATEAAQSLADHGVDYLVVTKLSHPDYKPLENQLELVFSTEAAQIYHVK